MKLEELLLTKKEIPIVVHDHATAYCTPYFQVPVHPRLLNPKVKIGAQLAETLLPQAEVGWAKELKKYAGKLDDCNNKIWILRDYFVSGKPKLPEGWGRFVLTGENGFANDMGETITGSLYFDTSSDMPPFKLAKKKSAAYTDPESKSIMAYHPHNVGSYPEGLFLRNWAILYLNAALKQVLGKKS